MLIEFKNKNFTGLLKLLKLLKFESEKLEHSIIDLDFKF